MNNKGRALALIACIAASTVVTLGFAPPASAAVRGAFLEGENEVPGPGDPNGVGFAELNFKPAAGRVCFRISYDGIGKPHAAHIHKGGAGTAGPIKVTLVEGRFPDGFEDCVRAGEKLIRAILADSKNYYVNLHNEAFPNGAIRGQIHKFELA